MLQVVAGVNPCFPADFVYKSIQAMDVPWENLSKHFYSSNRFIKECLEAGGAVFVHCYAGISRSATIVCAYLMQERGMDLFHALSLIKSKRPVAVPNQGF